VPKALLSVGVMEVRPLTAVGRLQPPVSAPHLAPAVLELAQDRVCNQFQLSSQRATSRSVAAAA
jgi:hypothetical protein